MEKRLHQSILFSLFIFAAFSAATFIFCNEAMADYVDAMTSATPIPAKKTPSHTGWDRSNCASCHGELHNSGYSTTQCTNCHGINTERPRLDGHSNSGCPQCHVTTHEGEVFNVPSDCAHCHPYEQASEECSATEDYDVVVIGAGGGGLSAAAQLSVAGFKVLVLEKSYRVGGCMGTVPRGEYNMEISLHANDAMGHDLILRPIFGIEDKIQVIKLDPLYKAVYPSLDPESEDYLILDIPADVKKYRALLIDLFPQDTLGIIALFNTLTHPMLFFVPWTGKTVRELVEAHGIYNEQFFAIMMTFGSSIGSEPDNADAGFFILMWAGIHQGGYYYWVGGSGAVANALAESIEEHNGTIRLHALATKIVIEDGLATQVRTADGACYNARYVVSGINTPQLISKLIGEENVPQSYLDKIEARGEPGLSGFHVYLGVNHDYTDLFDGPAGGTHGFLFRPSYDMMEPFYAVLDCDVENIEFILGNYSKIDPTAAPPGKNVIVVTGQVGFDCFNQMNWNDADLDHPLYKSTKDAVGRQLVARAANFLEGLDTNNVHPHLLDEGVIEVFEVGSPHTIRAFTLNPRGSIMGYGIDMMDQTHHLTPYPNMFIASAWAGGGGQTTVYMAGNKVAKTIIELERSKIWSAGSTVSSDNDIRSIKNSEIYNRLVMFLLPLGFVFFLMRRSSRRS